MEIKTDKSLFEGVHFYIYDKNVERASEVVYIKWEKSVVVSARLYETI